MAALFILPYIGALSDRTRTRIGRRKPFILVGAPLAALAFIGIPLLAGAPLPLFMAAVFGTLLTMDFFRTPVIALMPDLTPSPLRSQANGVINLMGGLGAVLAFRIRIVTFPRVGGKRPPPYVSRGSPATVHPARAGSAAHSRWNLSRFRRKAHT